MRLIALSLMLWVALYVAPTWAQPPVSASGDPHPEIPELLWPENAKAGPPAWVAATAATTPGGEVRWDLFAPDVAQRLQEELVSIRRERARRNGERGPAHDNCAVYHATMPEHSLQRRNSSPEELVDWSSTILSGKVLSVQPGFLYGNAGLLVRIRPDRQLKGGATQAPQYILYQNAKFRFDDDWYCVTGAREAHPVPGKRILLFVFDEARIGDPRFVRPDSKEVFFELPGGELSLPRHYGEARPELGSLTFSDLEEWVVARLEEGAS